MILQFLAVSSACAAALFLVSQHDAKNRIFAPEARYRDSSPRIYEPGPYEALLPESILEFPGTTELWPDGSVKLLKHGQVTLELSCQEPGGYLDYAHPDSMAYAEKYMDGQVESFSPFIDNDNRRPVDWKDWLEISLTSVYEGDVGVRRL